MNSVASLRRLRKVIGNLPPVKAGFIRVYRGQTGDYGSIKPSAVRQRPHESYDTWVSYIDSIARYLLSAARNENPDTSNELERLLFWTRMIIQHYGPGTEFLDVTHSYELATWFALNRLDPVNSQTSIGTQGTGSDWLFKSIWYRYVPADEGFIYAFDVPSDRKMSRTHGDFLDLTAAPPELRDSTRIANQQGCLIYADRESNGGELSHLLVLGTPIRIQRPKRGPMPYGNATTEYLFPSPSNDPWYLRLLSVPLVPDFELSQLLIGLSQALPVALYLVGPSYAQEIIDTLSALNPPTFYRALRSGELAIRTEELSALAGRELTKATPILLEGPLFSYGGDTKPGNWHQALLSEKLPVTLPASHPAIISMTTEVDISNVFIEVRPLEYVNWIDDPAWILRGVWLTIEAKSYTFTVFFKVSGSGRGWVCIGPLKIKLDTKANRFVAKGAGAKATWTLLRDLTPGVDELFIKSLSLLRDASPGLKLRPHPLMISTLKGGQISYLVAVQDSVCFVCHTESFSNQGGSYLVVRRKSDLNPYFGNINLDDPSSICHAFEVIDDRPFGEIDQRKLKKAMKGKINAHRDAR